jgi:RNA polymerase sigma-70 factor (ECF subfamily)
VVVERGEEPSFEQLLAGQIRENARLFFRLAQGILRDVAAAEDICQQAMLKACERRHELRDPTALRSWLSRVVVNDALQLLRRRKMESRVLGGNAAISSDTPAVGEAGFELREAVLAALGDLPESERVVVMLRLMDGQSGREVGKLLACSDSEISRRLHRAMEKLRQALADWQKV